MRHFSSVLFLLLLLLPIRAAQGQETGYVIGEDTKELLEYAEIVEPDNFAVAYYLGMVFLNEGKRDTAIEKWEKYLSLAPSDGRSAAVREKLTLLKQEQAAEYARNARKQGLKYQENENTLAVLNFKISSTHLNENLSKGLTAMIITDLSKVKGLQVVEREKIQALVEEISFTHTDLADESTAVRAGRFLRAKYIVRGSLADINKRLQLASNVTETLYGKDIGSPNSEGLIDDLFKLEKELVFGILEALGYKKTDMNADVVRSIEEYHTRNFDALMNYSQGLDFMDRQQFQEARQSLQEAVNIDSDFGLANDALMAVPGENTLSSDIDNSEWVGMNASESGDGSSGESDGQDSISLKSIEVIDTAQDRTDIAVSNRLNEQEIYEETPGFPGKPGE
ncbi:CsgG/HfaB family protein [Desulfobacterales bacterium HSG17]|nr:CsgG/HfaB family protein [Desulfobacterales bacterium HSG17]